ncbi:hypothetical protein GFP94_06860 [Salmonella enterica]|uniref:hypothetical protein n=1 Tax=Salmonella enterica TaxID=28901 RepID=UPI0009AA7B4C|nr:hypothetical protein [Salmonella enterica]EEN4101258.1 hypothetical protein [Salmonella enterica subsp. enterica serovar Mikawasima]EGF4901759.1 hypothetical protein [Salmonella enterica subsp. enterica serovar Bredeney]EDK0165906.1 hypothetical protein [Salmonella enterica]EDK0171235.1 hypothetical protein [Salmonella enterica]EJH2658943.1 hypothetical protein [Salmonella enterica]
MGNKVQVIFTVEREEGESTSKWGGEFISTTVLVQVDSSGLEKGNQSPEQLFGKILMREAHAISGVIQEMVYDAMRKRGSIIIDRGATVSDVNKKQTH